MWLVLVVAAIALTSATYAWFISNSKVTAEATDITSASATPSLYIKTGTDIGTDFLTSDTTAMVGTSALYPASTADLANWNIVSDWNTTSGVVEATDYNSPTLVESALVNGCGSVTYSLNGKTTVAYQKASYNLYTSAGTAAGGSLPVYIKSVTVTDSNTTNKLEDAIRIGIKSGKNMVIYAPVAESGKGNSSSAVANEYYAIDNTQTLKKLTNGTDIFDPTKLNQTDCDYVCSSTGTGTSEVYAKGKTALCTANSTTGATVEVYIWLEGTDAQCLVGTADGLTAGLKVNVEFAGIA